MTTKETPIPDRELTDEEESIVAKLTIEQIDRIDTTIISNAHDRRSKVAMVVAKTMRELEEEYPEIPDVPRRPQARLSANVGRHIC